MLMEKAAAEARRVAKTVNFILIVWIGRLIKGYYDIQKRAEGVNLRFWIGLQVP